jgi:nucleotide sugar dehydrogenase
LKVAVVGLGKIGLPLAVQYASRGLSVTGCDVDAGKVDHINAGDCPIEGETGLAEGLRSALSGGLLRATVDTSTAVRECDVVVIIVPVGLSAARTPDFVQLDAAVESVSAAVEPGTLVIVETTVPVGTTRGRVGERLRQGVLLAASPERVSSGRIFQDLRTYPKLVGPVDDESWERSRQFYELALEAPCVIRMSSPETAELTKLAEGIYRDTNIALASDLARYADSLNIDAREVFAAANSQPFSHIHEPGVGVGGHCLPIYPYFLPDGAVELAEHAREVNDAMAAYGVDKLERALGSLRGTTALIIGLAYRPNVKESANSSTFLLAGALEERGARVLVHDPLYAAGEIRALGLDPADGLPRSGIDVLVVQALHSAYGNLDLQMFAGCRALLDGRNVIEPSAARAAGMLYLGIGR